MIQNGLTEILSALQQKDLGTAIIAMENYLATNINMWGGDQLESIKNDYQLMVDFWLRGFDDEQRAVLYGQLLKRMDMLTMEMVRREWMAKASIVNSTSRRIENDSRDWSVEEIERQLETFVSDVAMLELEMPHVKEHKSEALYNEHKRLMSDLFDYVWTSGPWSETKSEAFKQILLLPTIDSIDKQLIVSAITLSLIHVFCINKLRLLVDVYRNADDEHVKQRALVGWVMGLDEKKQVIYPELEMLMKEVCADDHCRQELVELQMQQVYCSQADSDSRKIQSEIVPDLMKGNSLTMTRGGIVEMDDSSIDDILHPEKSEENVERMEKSIKRMADMQKRGSDIYFVGFSQMKRFGFFNEMANWFVPFYPNHPEIKNIWFDSKNNKFLKLISNTGAFCDSDKYSLVLAFDQIIRQMPESMLKAIREGDGVPMPVGGEVAAEEQRQPAFIRRLYLQNLYRFFALYSQRSVFKNPFTAKRLAFFANSLFKNTQLGENMVGISKFLSQHSLPEEAKAVLKNVGEDYHDINYHLECGNFAEALMIDPDNMRAKRGYARQLFEQKNYNEALRLFTEISEAKPDNVSLSINVAVCLSHLNRFDEALKILYRLNYNNAQDVRVNRVLAWTLLLSDKMEQSKKLYENLVSDNPSAEDYLNYGYCLWLMKNIVMAADVFDRFVKISGDNGISVLKEEFSGTFQDILAPRGITDVDVQLMVYEVSQHS